MELQSIEKKIRKQLKSTNFSISINDDAWEYNWMNGLRIKVSKYLDLRPTSKLLDVGCGDGWFSIQNALFYQDVDFFGIDMFEAKEAKDLSKHLGVKNCRFYEMDALKIKFKNKFDYIVLFLSLGNICENSSDMKKLFKNCLNVMKKDAKLLIVEPFEEDFPPNVRKKEEKMYKCYKISGESVYDEKENVLKRKSTLKILNKMRFKILKIKKKKFKWSMNKKEVMKYFKFEKLPFDIPKKFWVHDKPKQATIIMAKTT
jgi:SAM-dependent methyltransferase